jgi:hypothetical protein
MGRNNTDFQGSVLFHGSPSTIPIGGIVEPRNGVAHATPDIKTAIAFAKGFFGTGSGVVHEVVPLEGDESLFTPKKKPNEVRSTKGFRVVRHVDSLGQ